MKIHLSFLWILFLLAAMFSHAFKTFLILFLLLLIHELAHIVVAYFLHYEIKDLHIYPFGYSCEIFHLGHGKSSEEIMIVLAGLSMHCLFPYVFKLLYAANLISWSYLHYLKELNQAILWFNLLPIYPLDGGRLFNACLNYVLPYSLARKITLLFSFCFLLFFAWMNLSHAPNMIVMTLFLFYQQYLCLQMRLSDQLQFYYYRYHHPFMQKARIRSHHLYRNKPVFKMTADKVENEAAWLKEMFSKSK